MFKYFICSSLYNLSLKAEKGRKGKSCPKSEFFSYGKSPK